MSIYDDDLCRKRAENERWAAYHGHRLPETDQEAGIPSFAGTWIDRLEVQQLGKLSAFLSRAQSRAIDEDDRARATALEPLANGVWNMWCDKRFGGVGRWPARQGAGPRSEAVGCGDDSA